MLPYALLHWIHSLMGYKGDTGAVSLSYVQPVSICAYIGQCRWQRGCYDASADTLQEAWQAPFTSHQQLYWRIGRTEIAQGIGAKGAAAEAPSAVHREDWRIDAIHGNGAENHLTSRPQVLFM